MDERIKQFALTDVVVWNKEFDPTKVEEMSITYGGGPFKIRGLRLQEFTDNFFIVSVQTNIGRQDFASVWFKKVDAFKARIINNGRVLASGDLVNTHSSNIQEWLAGFGLLIKKKDGKIFSMIVLPAQPTGHILEIQGDTGQWQKVTQLND